MKKISIYIVLALSFLTVASCMVDDDVATVSEGDYIVGFKNSISSNIYTDLDVDPVNLVQPIDLVGGQNGTPSDEAIVVEFEIDPSSTAIAGTHYAITATGNTLTLEPGSTFVNLPITVYPAALPGNLPQTIVVNLTQVSSSNAVILEERQTTTITIAKCSSDLAGLYNLTVTRLDNNTTYNFANEELTQVSVGEYETSSTANYGPGNLTGQGAFRDGFIFNDVCQEVVIPEQYLGDYFSNLVYGNETDGSQGFVTLDTDTGEVESITMYYIVEFTAGNRSYKAVYTKL